MTSDWQEGPATDASRAWVWGLSGLKVLQGLGFGYAALAFSMVLRGFALSFMAVFSGFANPKP